MYGISKTYPGVKALSNVDFTLKKGEIHSLLGENGAGKTTLMKILYGIEKPDKGVIKINGNEVKIKGPNDAINLGIGMVHQHFMLVPALTITENIVVGAEPHKGPFFDMDKAVKEVEGMIKRLGFSMDPRQKVEEISVGQQQRVEILKALYRGADILILDEPTAVLTPQEVDELFEMLKELRNKGKSVIIITHKLKETMVLADRISVLRDGHLIQTDIKPAETKVDELATFMVGREVELGVKRRAEKVGDIAFEVKNLTIKDQNIYKLKDINLSIHSGEILGIAGIEGNGQTELIEALTGLCEVDSMEMFLGDKKIEGHAIDFIQQGIGHIPEDRGLRGAVHDMTIKDNLILGYHRLKKFVNKGIFKTKEINSYADKLKEEFKIKSPNCDVHLGSLSGGNQQKVIIARVFSQNPQLVIAAQPTRGVDVGAIEYIHHRLLDLRDQGKAILLISADLDEVRTLSDKIAVIYEGKIVEKRASDDFTEAELGLLMTGDTLNIHEEGKYVSN